MAILSVLGDYVRLARLHSSVLTGLTGLFGALAIYPHLGALMIICIFTIGICVHIFGFVLNEYFDLEVDKKSADLTDKPLVSGRITPSSAFAFAVGGAIASYLILFAVMKFEFGPWPFLFLTLTFAIFYAYDRWGKRLVITDALLAGFVGFLCLAGATIVGWPFNLLALVIAALAFLQLFLQNALAGLKDVSSDMEAGAKTTAIRLGVRITGGNSIIKITSKFKLYIMGVKILHFAIIFGFLFFLFSSNNINSLQLSAIILVVLLMLALLLKIFSMHTFERDKLLRLIGAHELVTYAAIPLLFIGILGLLTILLLIIFPVIWLACFMILMYGRLLPQI